MPKTYLNDADRAIEKYRRWYKTAKASNDITDEQIAKKIGVSRPAVTQKMKGGTISLRDALIIFNEMNASDEEILQLMRLRR